MSKALVYINGEWYNGGDAKISVFDPGFFYADGVFDTFRVYNGRAWLMKEHLERLKQSCEIVMIDYPKNLISIIKYGYRKSGLSDAFVRIYVTSKSLVVIIMEREENFLVCKKVLSVDGCRTLPTVKSLNYLTINHYKRYANKEGYDDIVLVDGNLVREGGTTNIFLIKNGIIYTPKSKILKGIVRQVVIDKFHVIERDVVYDELFEADEIFLTGTGNIIEQVIKIDGRVLSPNNVNTKYIASVLARERLNGVSLK